MAIGIAVSWRNIWNSFDRNWLNEVNFHRKSEIVALITASLLGMPGGCLMFMVFYHPLHDFCNVPSEVTSVGILLVATAIVWKYDRKSDRYEKPAKMNFISKLLFGHLILHYLINLGTVVFIDPGNVISIGLHQKVGNCHETEPVHTILKVFSLLLFYCKFFNSMTQPFIIN